MLLTRAWRGLQGSELLQVVVPCSSIRWKFLLFHKVEVEGSYWLAILTNPANQQLYMTARLQLPACRNGATVDSCMVVLWRWQCMATLGELH